MYTYTNMNLSELLLFFGIYLKLENIKSPEDSDMIKNFKQIKLEYNFSMGINRFIAILNSFIFEEKDSINLYEEINKSFLSNLNVGTTVIIDEVNLCLFIYLVVSSISNK
jgi:hypothetical protein